MATMVVVPRLLLLFISLIWYYYAVAFASIPNHLHIDSSSSNTSCPPAPATDPKAVQQWFRNLPNIKEKTTKLHFYFHDIVQGENPTAVTVAQSNSTNIKTRSSFFSVVRVMDSWLRAGPEPDSKVIGRTKGMYTFVDMDQIELLLTFSFVFTHGPYNGSTLSILGHNPIMRTYREIPIVGGSGFFRLARGIATAKTVERNTHSENAVVQYHLVLLHY